MTELKKAPPKSFGYKNEKEVLDTILDPSNGIEFVRVMFPDILGRPMDFAFPSAELAKAFQEGKGFDGSSVEGFVRIEESDLVIKPDPTTFRIFPWEYKGFDDQVRWREGILFGDILTPDGKPYEGDARGRLKTALAKCHSEFGIDEFKTGPELEFFLFPSDREAVPTDEGGYFFSGRYGEIRKEIQLLLKKMGIESEYDHHEVAHGQHEIDLKFNNALGIADTAMLFRYMVKRVARMRGVYATFMPKPIEGQNGSGMHVHQSLNKGDRNAFFDAKDPYHLSDVAKSYTAGILAHAKEFCIVTNQWINSYKRLVPGYEAPVYISWAQRNRSTMVRVPLYKPGKEKATRIEFRAPDPACNPYLAFAAMLAAGLEGIEKKYTIPAPMEDDIFEFSPQERDAAGIKTLPGSLYAAIVEAERSAFLRRALGDHIFQKLIENKKIEWDRYRVHVSRYEIDKYLAIL